MGMVNFTNVGPPSKLISKLRDVYGISILVETGTYKGGTAYWASTMFDRVITIEASATLYREVTGKYRHVRNIEFIHGDSREELRGVIAGLDGPSVFWLDGHWSGEATYGKNNQCPLIDEIEIINSSKYEHFILIDDARYFLAPPPEPHPVEQWPNICMVMSVLNSSSKVRYIVIFEDVIIAVPLSAKHFIDQYCRSKYISSLQEHSMKSDRCRQLT
jgi:hypothetical protein